MLHLPHHGVVHDAVLDGRHRVEQPQAQATERREGGSLDLGDEGMVRHHEAGGRGISCKRWQLHAVSRGVQWTALNPEPTWNAFSLTPSVHVRLVPACAPTAHLPLNPHASTHTRLTHLERLLHAVQCRHHGHDGLPPGTLVRLGQVPRVACGMGCSNLTYR